MRQNIASNFALLLLDQFYVRLHPFRSKRAGKEVADIGIGVKTTELQQTTESQLS